MKKRVGIPRALLYYKFEAMWRTFFEELGAEVIISPETTKTIKDLAVRYAPDEDCYSTKLYFGHALYLKDKVDYFFIPRFGSDHEVNVGCPKFIGLAQVLDSLFPDFPEIIMPYYSQAKANHGKRRLLRIIFEIGFKFTYNPLRILKAGIRAFRAQREYEEQLHISEQQLEKWINSQIFLNEKLNLEKRNKPLKLALVSHPYVLNDKLSNLDIKENLSQKGVDIITSQQMPRSTIEDQMEKLDFNMYFNYEREILGTIMYFLENNTIDGILQLAVFSCGPDSIVLELASRYSRRQPETPLLQLVIDELSSEVGFSTRIEAFIDMIDRRN
ncbi:MAG: acyl-CoA dehydratase activase-related protein [Candidatus Heimdallarchaeaceae archaeon]